MKAFRRIAAAFFVCLSSFSNYPAFFQRAAAYETVRAQIPVNCAELTVDQSHQYVIHIEPDSQYAPVPVPTVMELPENGDGQFTLDISEPGTFHYRVFEAPGDNPNIEYDSEIYDITLYVETSGENGLAYSITASKYGVSTKEETIAFQDSFRQNRIHATDPVMSAETTSAATTYTTTVSASLPASLSTADSSAVSSSVTVIAKKITTGTTGTAAETSVSESEMLHTSSDLSTEESTVSSETEAATQTDTAHSEYTDSKPAGNLTTAQPPERPAATTSKQNTITNVIGNVLTGESFPARTVRLVLIIAACVAVCSFLFRQKRRKNKQF